MSGAKEIRCSSCDCVIVKKTMIEVEVPAHFRYDLLNPKSLYNLLRYHWKELQIVGCGEHCECPNCGYVDVGAGKTP